MSGDFALLTAPHAAAAALPWPLLSVDVETNPADANRIFLLGAVRSDDDARALTLNVRRTPPAELGQRLDALADGVRFVVGHNLRRHDAPALAAQFAGLALLRLPVLDTLELSPLAFPTNPYHRLVKGYKLLSDSRNQPEKDARLALDLLRDEVAALRAMNADDPAWLRVLHHLLADDEALDALLRYVRGADAPEARVAVADAQARFAALGCATALAALLRRSVEPGATEARRALAYALGWVRVAGGNSVLPIWVHEAIALAREAIAQLRERDCGDAGCAWCRRQHDPEQHLRAFFDKPSFRSKPAAPDGGSLQRAIVVAGLARRSLLAVLPTGGGKSIGYQLPALVHYARAGQLTVIVSPLQSLMKDQVDGLLNAGVTCAVTINGLLTPLERRAALDKVRLGDAGIVLVSPEQFRSRTFTEAIRMREIAAWVFDEAHCLSKWGHDFRTDYLYVSRFVRENLSARPAPVACFTATAKPDVVDDLCEHFRESLGVELDRFLGGHERANLSYQVVGATRAEKASRIAELLRHELRDGGAAVVFCATRKTAETYAEVLSLAGLPCECFHGGMDPERKKDVQRRFLAGDIATIAATNAFGMGVDKPDIRVVVHADIPGSLENYLQEAGRAGRDGGDARCVLLFDEDDVESQFRLSATSKLTQRDLNALLKGIRGRSRRLQSERIVVSATELLLDSERTTIDVDAGDASTKVATAVAWLERRGFLKRDENASRVFPTSLRLPTLDAALARIAQADLPSETAARYAAVATTLFRSQTPEGVSTDELMLDAGLRPEDCFRILHQLEALGILANDLGLTARVSRGVRGASDLAFDFLARMESALLDLMADSPDADFAGGEPQLMAVRAVCTELRRRLGVDDGDARVTPQRLRGCLRSLADSFGSGDEKRSMMQVRGLGPDTLRVTLHRPWRQIGAICERRRAVAQVVLRRLLAQFPDGVREGGRIVECKARELLDAIDADLDLRGTLKDPALALEHALLYLHDNEVVELDRGRAVFRSAMTIRLQPEAAKRRFSKDDFAPLDAFYRERTLQTHVMHEYAKLGLADPGAARRLVDAYFTWPRKAFVREFFGDRRDLLELGTTEESFRRIVDDLRHPVQQALVEAPEVGNHLVLAGPGSGKTRVVVHRIAYLLRVRRVAPGRVIALAYNRSAAVELRRRLHALVGDEARGVAVMTYHAMALRLTGTSLAAVHDAGGTIDFGQLLADAVALLEGDGAGFGGADEQRERLLQGYEHILVDEYQDIDDQQYALVGALAGRRLADPDARLSILAVGDDDQNIYAFKGASVEFIRRFQRDYGGRTTHLVDNFRSTQHIVAAANHLIQRARDRMKVDHPIRVDAARAALPAGGRWAALDASTEGRVKLLTAPADPNLQAQLVLDEVRRILRCDPAVELGEIAVLARTHRSLEPVRAALELDGIRHQLTGADAAAARAPLMQSRQGARLARLLSRRRQRLVRTAALLRWVTRRLRAEPGDPYWDDIGDCVAEFAADSGTERVLAQQVLDALHEFAADARRNGQRAAVKLTTAHGAKGLEFAHVVVMDCGDWRSGGDDERRLLYVAMTRARQSLVLMRAEGGRNPFLVDLGSVDGVIDTLPEKRPERRPELDRRHVALGAAEMDLGFAGRCPAGHAVHRAIAATRVGDAVRVDGRLLRTADGRAVGRLAAKVGQECDGCEGRVSGILARTRARTDARFIDAMQVDEWEVVLAEVTRTPAAAQGPAAADSAR